MMNFSIRINRVFSFVLNRCHGIGNNVGNKGTFHGKAPYSTRRRRARMLGEHDWRRIFYLTDAEFRARLELLKTISGAKALKVSSVDLHKESNRVSHHTDEYEKEDLIIRRGQPFDLSIKFDRPINSDNDSIILQLTTGARPQESKGSLLRIPILSKKKLPRRPRDWTVSAVDIKGDKVKASLTPSPRAPIGTYEVYVETKVPNDKKINRYELEDEDIHVLFNAWCKDDPVFMADDSDRNEYVLKEFGRIWVGSHYHARPWNFGQFDNPCLDAAFTLLDKAELSDSGRGSVISVLRTIAAMTNSNDDDGVLEGRWSDEYPNGTKPWVWNGSVAILKEFMERDKPVKYGQCWVFSAVSTTLCRALGIPTRSVTNFQSAHDIDNSMTIDFHFDENNEPVDHLNDSVWNFHVWNESYLRRMDLPAGYDGWQAHDATPQELSEGVMRCGPASLKAIKEGQVYLSYDTGFIFSEVNGDRVHWRVDEDGSMEVICIKKSAVGRYISTKAKNSNAREDVTHLYKYPEGSAKEREVVKFANRFSSRADEEIYDTNVTSDVQFTLRVPEDISVTDDIEVSLVLKNKSDGPRTVKGRLSVLTSYYTGVPAKRLKGEESEVKIPAKQEKVIVVKVNTKEYQNKLNAEANFQACACYNVVETNQRWADTESFFLSKPPLTIKIPDNMRSKEQYVGKVTFKNPLDIKLTGASILVEGGAAVGTQLYDHKKAIAPNEVVSFEFDIKPRRPGQREVEATFTSDQLSGVDGSKDFTVK